MSLAAVGSQKISPAFDLEAAIEQLKALGYGQRSGHERMQDYSPIKLTHSDTRTGSHEVLGFYVYRENDPGNIFADGRERLQRMLATHPEHEAVLTPNLRHDDESGKAASDCRIFSIKWVGKELERWKSLNLPEPTCQLDDGQSIVDFWVLQKPVSPDVGQKLQSGLVALAGVGLDQNDLNRPIRLAGWHVNGSPVTLVSNSGKTYSCQELQALIPAANKSSNAVATQRSEPLIADKEAAIAHLSALGYQEKDRVYLRLFYQDKEKGGRSEEVIFPYLPFKQLEKACVEQAGVYFVVNGQGHKDADVATCRAIFYEHDDIPKDQQIELWKSLSLPEPTIQIDTGGKSIHSYWVFSEPIEVRLWKELQEDLLLHSEGDIKIKNPSRVMRLAGFFHNNGSRTTIVANSGQTYDYVELRALIPRISRENSSSLSWSEFDKSFSLPISDRVPLEVCLPRAKRTMAVEGIGQGGRNDGGWKLAADLIGTAAYLKSIGQNFEGDPRSIFEQYCESCSPPIAASEVESMWRSAQKQERGSSLPPEIINQCVKCWKWSQLKLEGGVVNSSTGSGKRVISLGALGNSDQEEKPVPIAQAYAGINSLIGDRLQFNELTLDLMLDGKPITIEALTIEMALTHNYQSKYLELIAPQIAERNKFNPIKEYLEQVSAQHGNDTSVLDDLALRYFGRKEPIYQTFVRRWLISAVARVFQPGCKVDTALILQGSQGINKSTFFKVLASEEWFDDSIGAMSDKDEKLKLHRCWIAEWAELEAVFKRKDVSQVKNFLSSGIDVLRPLYERSPRPFPRRSVIVGSTNEDEFLSDPTGNRRFWVIPVQCRIDAGRLRKERDQIWAAAVALYKSGEQWWLTDEECLEAEAIAANFRLHDPWLEAIESYLRGHEVITAGEILENCLKLEISKQDKGAQMRVASILKQLGWTKPSGGRVHLGRRQKVWVAPLEEDELSTPPTPPDLEVVSKVVSIETPSEQGFEDHRHHLHHLIQEKSKKIGCDVFLDSGESKQASNDSDLSQRSFDDLGGVGGVDRAENTDSRAIEADTTSRKQVRQVVSIKEEVVSIKNLEVGTLVQYVGSKFAPYRQERLVVEILKGEEATCKRPDGRLTTWLDVSELQLAEPA